MSFPLYNQGFFSKNKQTKPSLLLEVKQPSSDVLTGPRFRCWPSTSALWHAPQLPRKARARAGPPLTSPDPTWLSASHEAPSLGRGCPGLGSPAPYCVRTMLSIPQSSRERGCRTGPVAPLPREDPWPPLDERRKEWPALASRLQRHSGNCPGLTQLKPTKDIQL